MRNGPTGERMRHFERVCRQHGLPLTVQRRRVLEALLVREDHPTADDVYDDVKPRVPGISRTTVYRILDALVRLGIVTRICHPGSVARFDPKTHRHHHLVCVRCERIVDLEDDRLNTIPFPNVCRHEFEITDYHIHFRGLCAKCRKARPKGGGPSRRRSISSVAPRKRARGSVRSTQKGRSK